jgi:hypothetical protein
MSIFLFPNSLVKEIEKMLNAFWCGHGNGNNRGMHWLSCERLTVPKEYGGMGFKSLKAFNISMAIKQSWNLITSPSIVITRLLKARYFFTGGFFASRAGQNPSKGLEKHMKCNVNYLE